MNPKTTIALRRAEMEHAAAKNELIDAVESVKRTLALIEQKIELGLPSRFYIQDQGSLVDVAAQRLYDATYTLHLIRSLGDEV